MTDEEFYDKEIAPVLSELGAKCQARDMPFCAGVEIQPGLFGETCFLGPRASATMRVAHYNFRANGNIDALFGAIIRDAKKNGHSSFNLSVMGVPEKPHE